MIENAITHPIFEPSIVNNTEDARLSLNWEIGEQSVSPIDTHYSTTDVNFDTVRLFAYAGEWIHLTTEITTLYTEDERRVCLTNGSIIDATPTNNIYSYTLPRGTEQILFCALV